MPVIGFLILLFLANLFGPAVGLAEPGAGNHLEELHYRLNLGALQDVARVHLRLTEVGPGRYRAEFAGAAQGAWSLLSRWLPERYETEMALEDGRLKPLVYREEFQAGGHHVCKEYRFDYSRRLLTVWRSQDDREAVEKLEVPLQKPVYDPLTFFYNLRRGAFGPLSAGKTLKVPLVPAPEPRELVLRIGPGNPAGTEGHAGSDGLGERHGGRRLLFRLRPPMAAPASLDPGPPFLQAVRAIGVRGECAGEWLPINPRLSRIYCCAAQIAWH